MGNGLFYLGLDLLGRDASGRVGSRDLPDEVRYDDNLLAGFMAYVGFLVDGDPDYCLERYGPGYKVRFSLSNFERSEGLWREFSAGFSRITNWHLRRLLVFQEATEEGVAVEGSTEVLPPERYWHRPAEKAEACRALAAACRAWEPGVQVVWREITQNTGQIYPERFQEELKATLSVDPVYDRGRNMVDGDLATHLAGNLESVVAWIEAAAATGYKEVALVFIDV